MKKQIGIRLEDETVKQLETIAKRKHIKVSQVVRDAIRAYVEVGGNLSTSPALDLEEIKRSLQEIRWMITRLKE